MIGLLNCNCLCIYFHGLPIKKNLQCAVVCFLRKNLCIKYAWFKEPGMFNPEDSHLPRNFRLIREQTCSV